MLIPVLTCHYLVQGPEDVLAVYLEIAQRQVSAAEHDVVKLSAWVRYPRLQLGTPARACWLEPGAPN